MTKKNLIEALAGFTLDELRAEAVRRENDTEKWGFVVIEDSDYDSEEDDLPRFGIVPVAYWKEHGYIEDSHLGDRVTLPKHFNEVQECTVVYRGKGGIRKAKEILTQAGFEKLGTIDC